MKKRMRFCKKGENDLGVVDILFVVHRWVRACVCIYVYF